MSRWITQLRLALRSLFNKERVDRELDEELQEHLRREIEEGLKSGLGPNEARYSALRAMGAIAKSKDESRDVRGMNFLDDLSRDLRYAKRSLRRNPGFAVLAVVIMALGIGANTAVFSVVNAVLLKPLAYRDPDRIVSLAGTVSGARSGLYQQISIVDFEDWHNQSSSFESMAYYVARETSVLSGPAAEYAQVGAVGPEFFRVFAVDPVVGRHFTPEETKPGSAGAAMISYSYWQSHFGGDAHALGQSIRMFGRSLPVAGVLPPGFQFPGKTDVWVPASPRPGETRGGLNYLAAGRLKADVSLERAQAEISSIAQRLEREYPLTNKGRGVAVASMRDQMVGDVRPVLYLLFGAVSVVLLISCANTATLLLGKATGRTREVAVRVALGASRRRIVRQLATESLLLAVLSGGTGLLIAYWGSRALVELAPANLPRLSETTIDQRVLAFTFGISLITSLLAGLFPALYASKVDLNHALRQAGGRSVIGGMVRIRGALVVAEIALAVTLVAGAGLLIRSFVALNSVDLGFQPEKVLVMRATVPAATPEAAVRFFNSVLPQIATLPGVSAAGATMAPPGNLTLGSYGPYFVDHMPDQPDVMSGPAAMKNIMAPGTFAALGITLKSGRDFTDDDARGKPFVALVNEALVRESFRGQNPIGRRIFCPFDSSEGLTIIGVVADVRQAGPQREPRPECYMTYLQHAFNGNTLSVVVRSAGDPAILAGTLRRLTRERAPDVPVKFTTMEATLAENVAAPRFRTLLFGIFAGLAVCLAMAGVYGVMAFAVSQRSNEIGLRMALGATTGSILRSILGQGLMLASLGLALGLAAAIAGTRLLTSMLFQVQPNDPWVYLAVAILLSSVTVVASYVPARRAARIDPLTALRQE
jgi:putative ABC transport system permease protein